MILKELTPKQTMVWINNLDKLVDLYNLCQKHYYDILFDRRKQAEQTVLKNKWNRFWYGVDSWYDIRHNYDGTFITYGVFRTVQLKNITPTSWAFMDIKDKIEDVWIGEDRKEYVDKLVKKWGKYATRPFQIDGSDLEDYFSVLKWHQELKDLALEEGIYDETLNLDEDSV